MRDVEGKVAFITGGSSGIGLGIARAFADAGMKVVLTYRCRAHLDEAMGQLPAGGAVHPVEVDVTDRPGLARAAREAVAVFGKVHVLVSNAGVQLSSSISETSHAEWDQLVAANVTGVFNSLHALLPLITAHGEEGHVVATSSVAGLAVNSDRYGAYFASKFAVVGLLEALRAELAGTKVGVSLFCPGLVRTNLEEGLADLAIASDPLDVGRVVLEGLRRDDLYILTHPEFAPLVGARHAAIMGSFPSDQPVPEARVALSRSLLGSSIYAAQASNRSETTWTRKEKKHGSQ